ncbi:hypothetical protein [Microbispora rosea]|uniref:hypothetical protein n=1 Tax=Microbispora rosea TaxID=58117 RepID=UPI0034244754
MGMCTVAVTSRFAGGTNPMPPPPKGDPTAEEVFKHWLDWVNTHGITDLAAQCARNRAAQVAFQRGKVASGRSTWGNGSCFAVVEVLRRQGDRLEVASAAGWSQSESLEEGKVHAERNAIGMAYDILRTGVIAVTRVYVELAPCTRRAIRQQDTCAEWLGTIAPNATVMYTHEYPDGIGGWKDLNATMAREQDLYGFATTFANPGRTELSTDGLYVTWRADTNSAPAYHQTAKYLMTTLEGTMRPVVPGIASARVDGT